MRGEIRGIRDELRADIASSAAETRRHFDVVAESLVAKIQIVAEGVLVVDQKVDRLGVELRGEIHKFDRRLLNLEARILPKPRTR
jgi:hypothetical protein